MLYFIPMEKDKGIKAIIWDMGGVLLRTVDWSPRQDLAKRFRLTEYELMHRVFHSDTAVKAETGEVSYEEHWHNVLRNLGLEEEALTWFQNAFFQGDEIDNDLMDIIRFLRSKYKVGLLSNALPKSREKLEQMYDFLADFDDVIFSSEVGMRKPDPRIYQLALKRLGVCAEDAIFIDDMPVNVDGARALDMSAILFHTPSQVKSELRTLLGDDGIN